MRDEGKQIPRGSSFVQRRPRDGHAIFQLYRIVESLGLLILAAILLATALGIWWMGVSFPDTNYLSVFYFVALIVGVSGVLVLRHSLRSAFTSEALLWEHSAQRLHWIRKTPFSRKSDTLGMEERWDVLVVRQLCTDDDGTDYFMSNVSVRRFAGEGWIGVEWLRVAYYCGHDGAMRLAQELSDVSGRPMTWRNGLVD